jgi:hypothetical protein
MQARHRGKRHIYSIGLKSHIFKSQRLDLRLFNVEIAALDRASQAMA